MGSFYSRLSYSFGNEDWETEHRALRLEPHDRVLCITASGDRPLHLLLAPCGQVDSVDANPIQNHLLELKVEAMRRFDYEHYLAFLGATDHPNRQLSFRHLRSYLSDECGKFWDQHGKSIEGGILYSGATEKWCRRLSALIRPLRGFKIKRLFSFDDIEKQKSFVKQKWSTPLWRGAFELLLHPVFTRWLIKDPGLYNYLAPGIHPGRYVQQRLDKSLEKYLARENGFLSMILLGKVRREAFPPSLSEEGVPKIKKQLGNLKIHTENVISYLESVPENTFNAFSLSDVASYLPQEGFERLLAAVLRAAKPGARFCFRQFLSAHQIPAPFISHFKRDLILEQELEEQDRCFVYRFLVGSVEKGLSRRGQCS